MDLKACKAKINYPCRWLYKVIGSDQEQLYLALEEIIGHGACDISLSNSSSSGKYVCLNVEVFVESEEKRNSIYMDLKTHLQVRIVL